MQTRLELIHGDLIKAEVEAIVNPADTRLSGGGGMDRAIQRAGGVEVQQACEEIRARQGGCPTGKAVITIGGNLHAKYIIHTVGPVWKGGLEGEPALLESCYRECLQLAVKSEIRSIAFTSISTGHFKYPLEQAAEVALTTVKKFVEQAQQHGDKAPDRIQFALFDDRTYTCYVNALSKLGFGLFCLMG